MGFKELYLKDSEAETEWKSWLICGTRLGESVLSRCNIKKALKILYTVNIETLVLV